MESELQHENFVRNICIYAKYFVPLQRFSGEGYRVSGLVDEWVSGLVDEWVSG